MKKIFILIVIVLTLISCNNSQNNLSNIKKEEEMNEKIKITTSIIPLASLVNYVGWKFVEAKPLVPAWVSPHGFDLKPNQMIDIQNSDLIVYLWFDHIDWFLNKSIEWKNILLASSWIKLMEWSEDDEHHNGEELGDHKYENDPHIWTSAENALIIAKNIENKLIKLYPENKDYFENNYKNLENELLSEKQNFLDNITGKTQSEFIVFHDAYNYLFKELAIDSSKKLVFQTNILSDPDSAEMKKFIDEITLHWVNIAFKEPQLNDSNLLKLTKEYTIEIDTLDPLWTDFSRDWYINYYKNNLLKLQKIYE